MVCDIMYEAFVGLQFFLRQLPGNTSVDHILYLLLIHLGVTRFSSKPLSVDVSIPQAALRLFGRSVGFLIYGYAAIYWSSVSSNSMLFSIS